MPRPDRHNEIELNLLLSGSLSYVFGGRRVTIPERGLGAFWAAVPHQVVVSPPPGDAADYYVVTIPLLRFLQLNLPDRLVQPILHGQMVLDAHGGACGRGPRTIRAVVRRPRGRPVGPAPGGPPGNRGPVAPSGTAPPGMVTRHAPRHCRAESPRGGQAEQGRADGRPRRRHYTEPLSVEEVSRSVGLHPGYAMTLFRKTFGMTLVEYVTQHRLTHAQRLLATTDKAVLTVALESGFGSLSRFNDAFKRACGCTPQHRKECQAT